MTPPVPAPLAMGTQTTAAKGRAMPGMQKEGTVLIPSGPSHDPGRMHLHVVCTDPDNDGCQLIVSICTKINSLCDPSCTLQPHEHPFLTKESYVLYRNAEIVQQSAPTVWLLSSLCQKRI